MITMTAEPSGSQIHFLTGSVKKTKSNPPASRKENVPKAKDRAAAMQRQAPAERV